MRWRGVVVGVLCGVWWSWGVGELLSVRCFFLLKNIIIPSEGVLLICVVSCAVLGSGLTGMDGWLSG